MELDIDVREFLVSIRSLLSGLTVTAESPNFDTLQKFVAQALDATEALVHPIIVPEECMKEGIQMSAQRKSWPSKGISWH